MTAARGLIARYWRFAFAVFALSLLIRYVGLDRLLATLAGTRLVWWGLFVLAFGGFALAWGLQIWVGLRLLGHRPGLRPTLSAAANSWSVGILTPARSGDLSLAYFIGGEAPRPVALALVVIDKIFSLAFLALAALAATLWLGLRQASQLTLAAALLLVALAAGVLLLRSRRLLPALLRWSERFVGRRPGAFYEALIGMLEHRRYLVFVAAAVSVRWLLLCAMNLMLFQAVGHLPGYLFVVAATAAGRIIALIPVSIGGIGLKEPIQIVIYGLDGIPAEALIAVSLLGMAAGLLLAATLPLLMPWRRPSDEAVAG